MDALLEELAGLAANREHLTVVDVQDMIATATALTRVALKGAGINARAIQQITTKFRDAGRRSPPWKPASGKVPGRPQDGADGNRRLRWLFEPSHKFYADEINATLVEVRYYLQTLSMTNAPALPPGSIQDAFVWLTGHRIEPGQYRDPIQLIDMDLLQFAADTRGVVSGHLVPLDRGGRHEPANAFLMLYRSNQLQGNLTVQELLELMDDILARHRDAQALGTAPEQQV